MSIGTIPDFNKKQARNISCWLCEHFQRYDSDPAPVNCEGDCRKYPPNMYNQNYAPGTVPDDEWDGLSFWFYIPFGNIQWCNGFQASLEANIPPAPGNPAPVGGDCAHQSFTDLILPQVQLNGGTPPFSKKPILDSCWYCDHFQRFQETPTPGPFPCIGRCQIEPRESYVYTNPMPYVDSDLNTAYEFPQIRHGGNNWCNRWERTTLTVPDPPGNPPCGPPV